MEKGISMGFDKAKLKQICLLIAYTAVVILLAVYSSNVIAGVKTVISIFSPFIIGGVIAFILNLPMNRIEKKWFKKWNGKWADKLKRPISMILSILFVIAILGLVVLAVVPQLKDTIVSLSERIPVFMNRTLSQLEKLLQDNPELLKELEQLENIKIDWSGVTEKTGSILSSGLQNVVTSTVHVAGSILSGIANGLIAFVFALYILSQKEKLEKQGTQLLKAYLPKKVYAYTKEVLCRLYTNFSSFICGQCLEAVILGVLFVIAMTIFGMPYAVMVGTLIAFTALIPIVGAFIGCGIGAFMILLEDPKKALWFIVMFLILQQIEGNLIYPKVVGNSVGLPSIWVLMAVSVGGSLFGVAGMLVFIPLTSTIYSLLRDDVKVRNQKKEKAV